MRILTFDIETTGEFLGNGDFSNQEVTVVGVHDSETGELTSFVKEEFVQMWPLFEKAEAIVGFNSDHFDIPILNRYYAGDLTKIKSIDLLKEIKNVLGRRIKLDTLAEATLKKKKSGSGLDAVKWWAEGKVDLIRKYCLDDVKITRELYDYARKNGSLKYKDYETGVREIKLDTSSWETPPNSPGLTHTLPF